MVLLLKKIKKEFYQVDIEGNILEPYKFKALSKKELKNDYDFITKQLSKLLTIRGDIFIAIYEGESINNSLLLREFNKQQIQAFINEMQALDVLEFDTSLEIMGLKIVDIALNLFTQNNTGYGIKKAMQLIQKHIPKLLELESEGYKLEISRWNSEGVKIFKTNCWDYKKLKDVLL